jgi:hypothetical protein
LTGLPLRAVQPLQVGFLMLGLFGSLLVTHRLAQDDGGDHPLRAFLPWAAVGLLVCMGAIWLIFQPMEMRATFMSG